MEIVETGCGTVNEFIYSGVSVGVQTNGTFELLFYSLVTFFSHFTRSRKVSSYLEASFAMTLFGRLNLM